MFQKIINWALGYVLIKVSGQFIQKFISLCVKNKIALWAIKKESETVCFAKMRKKDFIKIKRIKKQSNVKIKIMKKRGLPFFINRYRHRYGLFAGFISFFIILYILSTFIWAITIEGNEKVSGEEILKALEESGLKPGSSLLNTDMNSVMTEAILKLDGVSYLRINVKGSYANVIIREETQHPEIIDKDTPCDIVSDADGIIESIEVYKGTACVKKGDVVTKGQILVKGIEEHERIEDILVHAQATIKSIVYEPVKTKVMFKETEQVRTGNKISKKTLNLFGFKINLFTNSSISYKKYDKIENKNELIIFNYKIPISLYEEVYYELEDKIIEYDYDKALDLAKKMSNKIYNEKYANQDIVKKSQEIVKTDESLSIINHYEIRKFIGYEREIGDGKID